MKFFLNWLDVEHEYECVDIFAERNSRSEEFLNASKFSEVPTLIDDDKNFIQSNAILVYLADKYGVFKDADEQAVKVFSEAPQPLHNQIKAWLPALP